MKSNAVIFDMDGVIIDSEPIHHKVNLKLFEELGINVTDKEYDGFLGKTVKDKWKYLVDKYNLNKTIEELAEIELQKNINYIKNNDVSAIDGLNDLLEHLNSNEYKIGLASSSSHRYIDIVLEELKIKDYFMEILSGENFKYSKPAPDIYIEMAKLLNIEPKKCVVIEDSKNGIISAKNAGMNCIGLDYSEFGNQDLGLADYIVNSLKDIDINLINSIKSNS